jgi:hypothetical protein
MLYKECIWKQLQGSAGRNRYFPLSRMHCRLWRPVPLLLRLLVSVWRHCHTTRQMMSSCDGLTPAPMPDMSLVGFQFALCVPTAIWVHNDAWSYSAVWHIAC